MELRKSEGISLPALLLALAGGFSVTGTAQAQTFTEAQGVPAPGNPDFSIIYAISGDGSTALGTALWGGDYQATFWDENGVPTLVEVGGLTSQGYGVNIDGSIVVGYEDDGIGTPRAVKWVNGVRSQL